jgi:hypothetical protein
LLFWQPTKAPAEMIKQASGMIFFKGFISLPPTL